MCVQAGSVCVCVCVCVLVCSQGVSVCVCVCVCVRVLVCRQGVSVCVCVCWCAVRECLCVCVCSQGAVCCPKSGFFHPVHNHPINTLIVACRQFSFVSAHGAGVALTPHLPLHE